ncbi:MAG: FAD-dependent oxidoreductase [Armatimonadetes bacterium]|nr:FAD-dependent oxidoreductase [Armatimonadota bacterium]MDW8153804.1 FAD-dependent oxidoreductase [Armatimonadota bacterium]
MSTEKFDAIVVGAGPAGAAAAITMAQAGLSVVLLERGEYPGAKNVMGGVMYGRMVADVVPEFWKLDAPLERVVVEERVWITTEEGVVSLGYRNPRQAYHPDGCPNAFTVLRARWDRWFAARAEEAGAILVPQTVAEDVIWQDDRIVGVRTGREEGDLYADVVVIADGVNSFLAQRARLRDHPVAPHHLALAVKEVIGLPPEIIESRFNLEPGQGVTIELYGAVTDGMSGYGFLYTNRDSLSVGVGVLVSHLMRTRRTPYELLERLKQHPAVRPLLTGGEVLEYAAHAIPEGGYEAMPRLFGNGVLIAGDAAMMVNGLHREGSNLAMAAGRLAGETVIEAKRRGDFSARTLALYEAKLRESFVLQDLVKYRHLPELADRRPDLFRIYPHLVHDAVHEMLTVDGLPKRAKQRRIWQEITRRRRPLQLLRDLYEIWRAVR